MRYLIIAILLCGCVSDPEKPPQVDMVRTERVEVPVSVPCELDQKTKDQRPKFLATNEELARIKDVEDGSRLLKSALSQYQFWVNTLENGFEECRRK